MSIKIGSRIFAPRLFTSLLAVAVIAMLFGLGQWQLRRAEQKRMLYDSFAVGSNATRILDVDAPRLRRYQQVVFSGHYDSARQILIDNMSDGGRVGYFVITPFALSGGGWTLINRGWVPLTSSRAERPPVAVPETMRLVRGRTDNLPTPGIRLAKAPLAPPYPVVASFPSHAELKALLGDASWMDAAEVVLLDPAQPDGYVRHWSAPGFAPVRHVGYALQWFALAFTVAIIYIVTNLHHETKLHSDLRQGRSGGSDA